MRVSFTKMSETTFKERFFDSGATQTFGKAWEIGQKILGFGWIGEEEIKLDNKKDTPLPRWGIYQKRHSFWKLVDGKRKFFGPIKYIRENFYIPKEPGTGKQPATWNNFKNGMAAWKALTSEEKQEYNIRANKMKLHGVNLFLREWLNSH